MPAVRAAAEQARERKPSEKKCFSEWAIVLSFCSSEPGQLLDARSVDGPSRCESKIVRRRAGAVA
jgi:hypothetical protein